ncbi:TetR family transcriptional regulator [Chryseobacterium sp. 7]|uniref:TetR/AcrR family transcriptional regulator n=1 Tax=Chryseobacterium sp. 7 TaxID=2035214 RepID=UPI000F28B20E|nr:TetR/AcrR family transcriptional regulator [Chryseobacterium sp. 7]RLJ32362.1 TetR family transcriptional regulator [Chryseobacterium sp. 7]
MFIPFFYFCRVNKKEQIIIAAMKLLIEKGVQSTPMSAIAKAAGTGMGTIYNYFSTKEELINAIYLYIKSVEVQFVIQESNESSLKITFLNYYKAFINFNIQNPEFFFFMDQMQNSPVITEKTREEGRIEFSPVTELILKGQKEGIIKEISMEAIIQFLGGTLTNYVRWVLNMNTEDQKNGHLEQQLRMVWDAIKE